jgi:hypothetical protein
VSGVDVHTSGVSPAGASRCARLLTVSVDKSPAAERLAAQRPRSRCECLPADEQTTRVDAREYHDSPVALCLLPRARASRLQSACRHLSLRPPL